MRLTFLCFTVILVLLYTSGCATSPPSQHFYLSPLAEHDGSPVKMSQPSDMTVAIAPIRIAKYIDRQQIVTRIGPNEIYMDEFNRWAGSLKDNITNVLVQNLTALLVRSQIVRHPVPTSMSFEYEVFVDIIQFDGMRGKDVNLIANVAVASKGTHAARTLRYQQFNKTEPVDTKNYDSIVAAKSRLLADLSREIAQTLNIMQANQPSENAKSGSADPQFRFNCQIAGIRWLSK